MCFMPDKQQLILHLDFCSHLDTTSIDLFTKFLDAIYSCCLSTLVDKVKRKIILYSLKTLNLKIILDKNYFEFKRKS